MNVVPGRGVGGHGHLHPRGAHVMAMEKPSDAERVMVFLLKKRVPADHPPGTAEAPWSVIKSGCEKHARLNAMPYLVHK